jgi:hypothetical protein
MHGQVKRDNNPLLHKSEFDSFSLPSENSTYDRGLALELSEAQNGSSGVVEDVEEGWWLVQGPNPLVRTKRLT